MTGILLQLLVMHAPGSKIRLVQYSASIGCGLDWETLAIGPLGFTSPINFDEDPLG